MPYLKDYDTQYGNLMSYKHYTRPEAYRLYGSSSPRNRTRHQNGMQEILRIMFANGACSTWEIARLRLDANNVAKIRAKEKEYRRLFLGRYDTKQRSGGMMELGLIVREREQKKKSAYSRYRLSLHGILYCIDVLDPSNVEIDSMTQKYAGVLPKIFGRWDLLKSVAGSDAYKLRVLSKGLLLNNLDVAGETPLYELMTFVHVKYGKDFESISEEDLAEQISCWYYTLLLYYEPAGAGPLSKRARARAEKMKEMLSHDAELLGWYKKFFRQARDHYKKRLHTIMTGSRELL